MQRRMKIRKNMIGSTAMSVLAAVENSMSKRRGRVTGSKNIQRTRKHAHQILRELGPRNVRKSYRMHQESFWKLHQLLFKCDEIKKKEKRSIPTKRLHFE